MKPIFCSLPLLLLATAVQNANAASSNDGSMVDDLYTMVKDSGPITLDVRANDKINYIGNFPSISNYDRQSIGYGSVVLNQNNTLTYTPKAGYVGSDTFTYEAIDYVGYGGTAVVTVVVTEAGAQSVSVARNKTIADMLDEVCDSDSNSELSNACNAPAMNPADREKILAEIAPDEALIQRQLLAQNARNNASNIYRTQSLLRSGSGGTSVSINDITLPTGGSAGDGFSSPWTLLSSIQVDNLERDTTLNEAGYDAKGLSLMLGLGYRFSDNINLGAALDWTNYDVDYTAKSGTMDADIYSLTGFLSWYKGPLSVDVQAGYTQGQSDAQRRFSFPVTPVAAVADSSYDSSQLTLSTRVEWAWQSGALALKPFVRIDYLDSDIDGYSETGNSVWLMQADKQQQQLTNASIGLDSSYTLSYSWGVLIPNLKMSLVSQDNLSNDPVAFQLINADSGLGRFELKTDSLDTRFYQWEVNSVMVLKNGLSAFIALQTLSNYDNVSSNRISFGLNKEF